MKTSSYAIAHDCSILEIGGRWVFNFSVNLLGLDVGYNWSVHQRHPPMKSLQPVFKPNTLCQGDCLPIMRAWADAGHRVDLIYLDPPFNSDRNYNILVGRGAGKVQADADPSEEQAQLQAFKDTWYWDSPAAVRVENIKNAVGHPAHNSISGLAQIIPETGMLAYVSYMAERAAECQRLLKDSGSLYLHCDPVASHYLKILLDDIFGNKNFRNEIIWGYRTGGASKKRWSRKHDVILYYAKDDKQCKFNTQKETILYDKPFFTNGAPNEDGKYEVQVLKRDIWDSGSTGDDQAVKPIINVSKERLDYPTQKPVALLKRIVAASSNKGDYVLDPFCGCGTSAAAAHELERKFLGIDISPYMVNQVCKTRLKDARGVSVQGLPTDIVSAEELFARDPFVGEQWAISCLPGFMPNTIQRGDGGVDGHGIMLHKPAKADGKLENGKCVAQVKGGKNRPAPDAVRALVSKLHGGRHSLAVFITLHKRETQTIKNEIAAAGTFTLPGGVTRYNRLIFWSMEEYFNGQFPTLPEMAHPMTGKSIAQQDMLIQSPRKKPR